MKLVATTLRAYRRPAAAAFLAAAFVTVPAIIPAAVIPVASADCPGAEVVFARGREEPPGVGAVGDAFVGALRSKTGMSVGVYGVNYPANVNAAIGAADISNHVQSMAKSCPNTREIIGGYSLGATAADMTTRGLSNPIPPGAADHVAAVALFGNGAKRLGAPPGYGGKWIDQCADGDPICGRGASWPAHLQPSYIDSGLVDQAAGFVAGKL